MNNEEFLKELEARTLEADETVTSFLPTNRSGVQPYYYSEEEAIPLTVEEAMAYSVKAGGKRLRPIIMRLVYEHFSVGNERISNVAPLHEDPYVLLKHFMAAIEFIHTYSLIHDDLPAMDNDSLRRGMKTNHVVYGEAMAILAGDGLLNFAYETAMKATEECVNYEELMRVTFALRILSAKAGIYGMVGGQCVDIETEKKGFSDEEAEGKLFFIHENKTGALIEASFMCGAILAGANVKTVDILEKTASLIGHAFQIRDDILDETGDTKTLGKTAGKDKSENKLTAVRVYGVDGCKDRLNKFTEMAVKNLAGLGISEDSFLTALMRYLVERDR